MTLYADGSFVYTPEAGDRSVVDSFTYTIQDAEGTPAVGTVTLNVGSTCVWFVDNIGDGATDDIGTGTSSDPFTSLVDEIGPDALADDAEDASQAGDIVYVFTGDSTSGDPYTGGYTAQANEIVLGEGVDLVVDLGSGPETLFDSTTNTPPLVDAPGDAFTVSDVTGVEIAGFEIDAGDNALDFKAPATGAGAAFHDNTVTTSVGAAILANPVAGVSQLSVVDNDIASSDQGVDVDAPVATLDLVVDGNTFTTDDTSVDLNGAETRVTSICGNTVSGDSGNHGIALENVLLDADPGTVAFDQVTCAQPTTVGTMGNPVPRHGITLDTVRGDLDLGQVTVYAGTAGGLTDLAFSVTGDGTFNAGAGTGFQLTTTGGTVHAVDGPALRFVDVDLQNMVLTTLTVDSSGGEGVRLEGVTGSLVTNGGDSTIVGTGDEAFYIVDTPAGGLSVTYDGSIVQASGASALLVENHPAGTVTFDGASIMATAGDGLQFTNADGTYQITTPTTLNGGDAGVDIVIDSSGSFTFTNTDITSPSGPGINIESSGPSTVSFGAGSAMTYATASQPAVAITGRTAGVFTYSGTINATNGTGLQFSNDDGSQTNFNNTVTLNGGDAGIDIVNGSSASYTFSSTTITNPSGTAFNVDSSGPASLGYTGSITKNSSGRLVSINAHSGGALTFSGGTLTQDVAAGTGIVVSNKTGGTVNFTSPIDLGATNRLTSDAVTLSNNSGGTTTFADLDARTSNAQGFVKSGGGTVTVTTGTVDSTGSFAGAGIDVSGGTTNLTFSDVDVTNNGAGGGVSFSSSAGTKTLGALNVTTTTSGTGLFADTAGTLNVTGAANTISATGGVGVQIVDTTIGASDVTFQSVSSSSAANGIVLDTTGTSGDFTVTGDGGVARNGSGGTVTNTTGDAVSLTNANGVTLEQMTITNCGDGTAGDDCIDKSGGNGITLSAVQVENATGTGVNEDFGNGLRLTDVTGTSRIDNDSLFTNFPTASTHAVRMRNTDTNGNLVLDDSGFTAQGATNSATYVTVQSFGSSNISFTVTNDCQFTGLRGDALLSAAGEALGSTGTVTTLIEGSDFLNAAANGSGAIAMTVNQSGATHNVTVEDNVFNNLSTTLAAPVGVITTNIAGEGGTLNATIQRNDLDIVQGTRRGIQVVAQPSTVSGSNIIGFLTLDINNNTIDRIPGNFAILVDTDDRIGNSIISITDNQIGQAAGFLGNVGEPADGAFLLRTRGTPAATNTITISNNNIRLNTNLDSLNDTFGRGLFLDARDDRTSNIEFTGNTIRNDDANSTDPEFFARAQVGSPAVCLNLNGNNVIDSSGASGSGTYELRQVNGTFNVEDVANVGTNNQGTVTTMGTIGNSANCI